MTEKFKSKEFIAERNGEAGEPAAPDKPKRTRRGPKSHGVQIKELQEELRTLRSNHRAAVSKAVVLAMKVEEVRKDVDLLDPDKLSGRMRLAREDALHLHTRLRAMVLRQSVLTELSFALRHHAPEHLAEVQDIIVRAFDLPDSWWERKPAKHTIAEWIRDFRALKIDEQGVVQP